MSKSSVDVVAVLNRLADALGIEDGRGRDAELARRLGLASPTVIGNWKRRKTLDYDLIISKALEEEIDLTWLFSTQPYPPETVDQSEQNEIEQDEVEYLGKFPDALILRRATEIIERYNQSNPKESKEPKR